MRRVSRSNRLIRPARLIRLACLFRLACFIRFDSFAWLVSFAWPVSFAWLVSLDYLVSFGSFLSLGSFDSADEAELSTGDFSCAVSDAVDDGYFTPADTSFEGDWQSDGRRKRISIRHKGTSHAYRALRVILIFQRAIEVFDCEFFLSCGRPNQYRMQLGETIPVALNAYREGWWILVRTEA